MKTIFDINKDKSVKSIDPTDIAPNVASYHGKIQFKGDKRTFFFIMSMNEPVGKKQWEHVSVHILGKKETLPSWTDMCRIKDIFWNKDEEAHQIHPTEESYIHGVMGQNNVLHIWRPVDGWGDYSS